MITERQLVENNVLYGQNEVVSELLRTSAINGIDDCIYEAIFSDEILEWWLVTAPFARLLQAEGEYILEKLDCYWWGRTTSGMAIYMDSVITDIVNGAQMAYVILPTGMIQMLTPELLLELCKDNQSIVKEIQGTKLKKNDTNKMFEILRQYNLTKE